MSVTNLRNFWEIYSFFTVLDKPQYTMVHLWYFLLRCVDLHCYTAELAVGLGQDVLHVGPQVQQAPLHTQPPLLVLTVLAVNQGGVRKNLIFDNPGTPHP